jgi:hypothetical protein
VPKEGLEPSHPKAQEPKSCVSTSSTTPALFDCSARSARIAPLERAYFVVARGRKHVPSLRVYCSLRSLRLALVSRCLPHLLADERHVCSLARPGQRRASLLSTAARDPGVYRWRSRLSLSTWPVAFTLYWATAMVPCPFWSTSMTKVERITPWMSLP